MNQDTLSMARQAYAAKDFQNALSLFTNALQDPMNPPQAGEVGLLYHQIGNCLVKLGNVGEAVNAYLQATNDTAYDAIGSVCYNLGTSYASLRDYGNAIKFFEKAVTDKEYPTPFKAYSGLGSAYMKMGKSAEAGIAFREAALDPSNPNPAKALLSLGVCFMALGRPEDAVTSYESALQFDMPSAVRNKLYANLGQAYTATGQMQKAVEAFEDAIADKSYFLSDSASVDYQSAIAAVSQGTMEIAPEPVAQDPFPGDDFEGTEVLEGQPFVDTYETPSSEMGLVQSGSGDMGYREDLGQDAFFDASEEDIENWAKGQAKQERKKKNTGLKVLIVIIIILLLLCGGAVFAYMQGFGYPMQSSVVEGLFDEPTATNDAFADGLSETAVASMCDILSGCSNVTVDATERGMSESVVYATGTTPEGGEVHYKVTMVRDKIGWKVSNVELFFLSQSGAVSASSSAEGSAPAASSAASSEPAASSAASSEPAASGAAAADASSKAEPSSKAGAEEKSTEKKPN